MLGPERVDAPPLAAEATLLVSPTVSAALLEAAAAFDARAGEPARSLAIEPPSLAALAAAELAARGSSVPAPAAETPRPMLFSEAPRLSLEDAQRAMQTAASKDDIAAAVLGFLRSRFSYGIIFIARDAHATGWRGFGPGLGPAQIEAISVPLTVPSMLQIAYERRAVVCGPLPEIGAAMHARFYAHLMSEPPQELIVSPITVSTRVVNLIYAHAEGGAELHASAASDIAQIAKAAGEAFVHLIRSVKSASRAEAPAKAAP
jgi:hypothetical protein